MGADEYAGWVAYQAIEDNPMLSATLRKVEVVQTPTDMMNVAKLMTGWFRG